MKRALKNMLNFKNEWSCWLSGNVFAIRNNSERAVKLQIQLQIMNDFTITASTSNWT